MLLRNLSYFTVLSTLAMSGSALAIQFEQSAYKVVPDVHALRYYASTKQDERYKKELARLRVFYPKFAIPLNLGSDNSFNEDSLWEFYSRGDFKGLMEEIAKRQERDHYWQPSPELRHKLFALKSRKKFVELYEAGELEKIKALANDNPEIIDPDDPFIILTIGEVFALEGAFQSAAQMFDFAYDSAKNLETKVASMQYVAAFLPREISKERLDRTLEEGLAEDLSGRIRDGFARGLLIRNARFPDEASVDQIILIDLLEKSAVSANNLDDLGMLAWYRYEHKQYLNAAKLFKMLPLDEKYPKNVEGLILSLRFAENFDEARSVAEKWKSASADVAKLYVHVHAPLLLEKKPVNLTAELLGEFADTVKSVASGEGAEALGWLAYNSAQLETAAAWFEKAIEWDVSETAVYGRVLVAARRKEVQAFKSYQARYGAQYPMVAKAAYQTRSGNAAKSPQKMQPRRSTQIIAKLAQAHRKGRYGECIQLANQQIARGKMNAKSYEIMGWCLSENRRFSEAKQAFAKAEALSGSASGRGLARYGQTLSALNSGNTEEAWKLASSSDLNSQHRRAVDVAILKQRALAAFRKKEYRAVLTAIEALSQHQIITRDLAMIRGWSYYHLGERRRAKNEFRRVDRNLSTANSRKALRIASGGEGSID